MASKSAFITTLVIFVLASFSAGLVIGVSIGRSEKVPAQANAENTAKDIPKPPDKDKETTDKGGQDNAKVPKEDPEAPDFSLEDPGTGETVELEEYSGSYLLLMITTTT